MKSFLRPSTSTLNKPSGGLQGEPHLRKVRILILVAGLVLMVAITACTMPSSGTAISCDELRQEALHEFIRTQPNEEQLLTWLRDEFQIEDIQNRGWMDYPENKSLVFSWDANGRSYTVLFTNQTLQYVTHHLRDTTMTVAGVVECLGEPEQFSTRVTQGVRLDLDVWYPESGIEVNFARMGNPLQEVEQMDEQISADAINYLPTDTLEAGFNLLYQFDHQELQQGKFAALRPWVQDISTVEVRVKE